MIDKNRKEKRDMSKFKKGDKVAVIDHLYYRDCEVVDVEIVGRLPMYSINTQFEKICVPESQVFAKDDASGIIVAIRQKITYWECELNEETNKIICNLKK